MKLVVWLLGALFALAVLWCKWISFPLGSELRGLRFSLLGYRSPHPFFCSYGALAALLILASALAFQRRNVRVLCLAGGGLLMLALAALLQVAFCDAALLKQLADEADQRQMALYFSKQFLPTNVWIEPARWRFLRFDSLAERLVSGWYFLSFGWYVAISSGVASLSAGMRYLDSRQRTRALFAWVAALICLAVILSQSHLRAELALSRGTRAESAGQPQRAVESYREAIRLDGWNQVNPYVYGRIGAIDSALGRTSTFEYRIYSAESLASHDDFLSAIAEYQKLAVSHPEGSHWLRRREAELWTGYGQSLLESGATGAAVIAWQKALTTDPRMWPAAFFLSRGYFLTGRNQEAVDLTKRLLDQLSDPVARAELYCNLGDAYMRLGALHEAHIAYRQAWTLDQKLDRRSLASLVGP